MILRTAIAVGAFLCCAQLILEELINIVTLTSPTPSTSSWHTLKQTCRSEIDTKCQEKSHAKNCIFLCAQLVVARRK